MVLLRVISSKGGAQAAIETLVILSIGIFILTVLITIVYDQVNSGVARQQQKQGLVAVQALASAIDDAYFLGPGTVINTIIELPSSSDFDVSFISGKDIVLYIGGTPVFASTDVNIAGAWPNSTGSNVFVLTVFDDFVLVSTQNASFSPASIIETLSQSSSRNVTVTFTNISSTNYSYLVTSDLNSGASVSFADSNPFSINAGTSTILNFTVACSASSAGSYSGKVVFVPQSSTDVNLSLPLNILCSSGQTKLAVFPLTKTIDVNIGESFSDSMLVCNTSSADFSSAVVSVNGSISGYVFPSISGSISANSCKTISLLINPFSLGGNYSGNLTVLAGGLSTQSAVNVDVS